MANFYLAILAAGALAAGIWFYRRKRRPGDPAQDYAVRRDWTRSTRSLNYSSFVYLDVDRDGRYGVGDRPMAGIVVRLSGAKGHLRTASTNINGFANFRASTRSRRATIRRPGTYRFSVSVPPGFVATSDNQVQSKVFRTIAGSRAGLGSEEMIKPVGLAPVRRIDGHVAPGEAGMISALRAGEILSQESLEPDRPFRFPVPEGADTVTVAGVGLERRLTLSPYPADLGMLSAERAAIPAEAILETIDFDDVTLGGLRKIPSGYGGLNWFNLNVLFRDFQVGGQGYINGNTSGHHLCYTSSGHPAEIWNDRPFGFHSVMLTAAWLRSEGEVAKIESWNGEKLVASDEVVLSALTPLHYAPMLAGITRIRISSEHYWQVAVDDLRVAR